MCSIFENKQISLATEVDQPFDAGINEAGNMNDDDTSRRLAHEVLNLLQIA